MSFLEREEYIEQAYLFRTLRERIEQGIATQDLLASIREEILSTTKLPMAVDFLSAELRHQGRFRRGHAKAQPLFTPVSGVRRRRSGSRARQIRSAAGPGNLPAQRRTIAPTRRCRKESSCSSSSRSHGTDLATTAACKPLPTIRCSTSVRAEWILTVRRQIGLVDFAEMIYVRSQHYVQQQLHFDLEPPDR